MRHGAFGSALGRSKEPSCDKMSQRGARQSFFDRHLSVTFDASSLHRATRHCKATRTPVRLWTDIQKRLVRFGWCMTNNILAPARRRPALRRRDGNGADRCARSDRADPRSPATHSFGSGPCGCGTVDVHVGPAPYRNWRSCPRR